jgi:hypothetical protein
MGNFSLLFDEPCRVSSSGNADMGETNAGCVALARVRRRRPAEQPGRRKARALHFEQTAPVLIVLSHNSQRHQKHSSISLYFMDDNQQKENNELHSIS